MTGCLGGLTSLARAGGEIFWYPFARAWGSPSEAELAKCRQAYRQLKGEAATEPLLALPVLVVKQSAPPRWRADLARPCARGVATALHRRVTCLAEAPDVAPAELGHNQLRYAWARAREYAAFVARQPAEPGHRVFAEVWVNRGNVAALHVFVISPAGQIAYCRWWNSHQFGPRLSFGDGDWIPFLVDQIHRDFARSAEELFPPYGVG